MCVGTRVCVSACACVCLCVLVRVHASVCVCACRHLYLCVITAFFSSSNCFADCANHCVSCRLPSIDSHSEIYVSFHSAPPLWSSWWQHRRVTLRQERSARCWVISTDVPPLTESHPSPLRQSHRLHSNITRQTLISHTAFLFPHDYCSG